MQSTDVAVIGAGPYGLAVSAHLLRAGISTRTFGVPMLAWTDHMPKGMFLKSAFDATNISAPDAGSSLIDFCITTGIGAYDDWHPIAIEVFSNYGLRFQERNVSGVEQKKVTNVAVAPGGFRLTLEDGESFAARRVIAASGHLAFTYVPKELRPGSGDALRLVTHASEHSDFAHFRGKEVAIVGAGQSALESAVLLHEVGARVHLVVRDPVLHWGGEPVESKSLYRRIFKPRTAYGPGWSHVFITEAPGLIRYLPAATRLALVGRTYGPSGAWWLRPRFDAAIKVSLSTAVEEAVELGDKVSLHLNSAAHGANKLTVDHVIAGTGYKVDVGALPYLDAAIRSQIMHAGSSRSPQLSNTFESSVPGLYFVGLTSAATFGPLLRFVHGTDFAARTVCGSILRQNARPLEKRRELAADARAS